MGNLIQAEMLKLSKSFGYTILLLCSAAFGVFVGGIFIFMNPGFIPSGYTVYMDLLNETQSKYLLLGVFAATFIGNEFSQRTFGIAILSGCSRISLLLAKAAVYTVGLIPLILLCPLVGSAIMTFYSEFGEMNPELWQHLFLTSFSRIVGMITVGFFCFMFALLTRKIAAIIGGTIGILVLLETMVGILSQHPTLSSFTKFVFTYQLLWLSEPESLPLYYLVMFATIALSFLASISLFKKAELK